MSQLSLSQTILPLFNSRKLKATIWFSGPLLAVQMNLLKAEERP
jgi:hypothetical protein